MPDYKVEKNLTPGQGGVCEAVPNIEGVWSGQWAQKEFQTPKISAHFLPQAPWQVEITAGRQKKIADSTKFWQILCHFSPNLAHSIQN